MTMTIAAMPVRMPRYRFTRAMYDQMVDAGILEDQHVELVDGEIIEMSPIRNPHVVACTLVTDLLREAFGKGFHLRVQAPLAIGDSEPQPDIAVIDGGPRDYDYHPFTAKLVVEIADSSLRYDQTVKASLYASARIREYWVVNLQAEHLEVFRAPKADSTQPFGFGYSDVRTLKKKESIVPLAAKGRASIIVADMLP